MPVPDPDYLREYYKSLDLNELRRLVAEDLVPEARQILEAEIGARGIRSRAAQGATDGDRSSAANPYAPPEAVVADRQTASGGVPASALIRIFHLMVIAGAVMGLVLFASPWFPLPMTEQTAMLRGQDGAEAISYGGSSFIFMMLQPLWILSAIGLYFFNRWARRMFIGCYAVAMIGTLIGGVVVMFPWESALLTIVTLVDGAVIALAFASPLSKYFEQDRT